MRNLVYYVATSIDGFIADVDGDFSAFPQDPATLRVLFDRYPETCPVHVREPLGVTAPPRRFDAVIMGRRTHQPALDHGLTDGAYPHLTQYVVTDTPLPDSPFVLRVSEDPAQFVADLDRPAPDWRSVGRKPRPTPTAPDHHRRPSFPRHSVVDLASHLHPARGSTNRQCHRCGRPTGTW